MSPEYNDLKPFKRTVNKSIEVFKARVPCHKLGPGFHGLGGDPGIPVRGYLGL